jgi:hypothetical protein
MMHILFTVLAKIFLEMAISKTLKKALPNIFKEIDSEVPKLIINNAPKEIVSYKISQAIAKNMNGNVSKDVLDIVTMLYDPAKVGRAE